MGYAITQRGKVNSATLGKRHKCNACGTAWYDLGQSTSCPGPSSSVTCEEGALLRVMPEEPEVEEETEEESVVYLMPKKGRKDADLFDDPEDDDFSDDDWTEDGEVEYINISEDEDEF